MGWAYVRLRGEKALYRTVACKFIAGADSPRRSRSPYRGHRCQTMQSNPTQSYRSLLQWSRSKETSNNHSKLTYIPLISASTHQPHQINHAPHHEPLRPLRRRQPCHLRPLRLFLLETPPENHRTPPLTKSPPTPSGSRCLPFVLLHKATHPATTTTVVALILTARARQRHYQQQQRPELRPLHWGTREGVELSVSRGAGGVSAAAARLQGAGHGRAVQEEGQGCGGLRWACGGCEGLGGRAWGRLWLID